MTTATIQPKFKTGRPYEARRGRKMYDVLDIAVLEEKVSYVVRETMRGEEREYAISQGQLLERARLKKKTKGQVQLSASQMGTFRRCERKWAFTYIDSEIGGSSAAQAFGTEVHEVLEIYMKTGAWVGAVDAIACARQAEHVLPERSNRIGIEQPLHLKIPGANDKFIGFIDLVDHTKGPPEVIDYKTTKDLRYAKTPEDLLTDEQANIYSKWMLEKHPSAKEVKARWLYVCARPSRAKAADIDGRPRNARGFKEVARIKTRQEVDEQWVGLLADAKKMVAYSEDRSIWAKDIPGNEDACWDYGGCPFRSKCNIQQTSLGGLLQNSNKVAHSKGAQKGKEDMSSLMDIINRNKGKTESAAPAEAAPVEAEPKRSKLALAAEKALADRQKEDGATGVNPPPVEAAELDPELAEAIKEKIPETWRTRVAKGHKARNAKEEKWRAEVTAAIRKAAGDPVEDPASTVVVETHGTPQERELPPSSPHTTEISTEEAEALVAAIRKQEKEPGALQPVTSLVGPFILMVDCVPAKGADKLHGMTTLSEVLRPMKDAVQQMKDVPHWNLLKYREGETLLAACVEQQFRETGSPLGIVLVDSSSGEWKACGDVLTELADVVIRG